MTIEQARQHSVQTGGTPVTALFAMTERGPILPPYGTQEREIALRRYYRHDYNLLVQGAFAGLLKKVASTPWHISGPAREAGRAQRLLQEAQFGAGWRAFVMRFGLNFLRHDRGAFWELIGHGDPAGPLRGLPVGLASLDSLRCRPTGDADYPVLVQGRDSRWHRLHRTRVVALVDLPDDDDGCPGVGLCALSRAISVVMREILAGRYVQQKLDDNPPPGIVTARNLSERDRAAAVAAYRREQQTDERPLWGRQLWFYGLDPAQPVEITAHAFASAPENFDLAAYTELHVNALALALGVSKLDLWELGGGGIGTGAQAQLLTQRARGNAFGDLLTSIERALNWHVLPEAVEFSFKFRDPQEELERAQMAARYAQVSASLAGVLSVEERRRLLAGTVDAVRDALSDAQGRLRLGDADRVVIDDRRA